MILTSEQPLSAHRALTGAGVKHGDTTEVKLALGVMPVEGNPDRTHVAFCSAWAQRGRIIKKGWWWDRQQAIDGEVVFENSEELARQLNGKKGMAVLTGHVHANGKVTFTFRPEATKFYPVEGADALDLRSVYGQRLAREALQKSAA